MAKFGKADGPHHKLAHHKPEHHKPMSNKLVKSVMSSEMVPKHGGHKMSGKKG